MSFGSPASDYVEDKLDLNHFLINHPASTFFMRMQGDSLLNEQIADSDILVIDRTLTPQPGQLIIIETVGELRIVRFKRNSRPLLVWGVVSAVIRKLV